MGRPSCLESRPRRHSEDGEEEHFPRRLPRLGGGFQAKEIPDMQNNYRSGRQVPLIMSSELPFLTAAELPAASLPPTEAPASPKSPWSSLSRSFLRPGYQPADVAPVEWVKTEDTHCDMDHIQDWTQQLVQWYIATEDNTTKQSRRKPKKKRSHENPAPLPSRKHIVVSEEDWNHWLAWSVPSKRRRTERGGCQTTLPTSIWGDFRDAPHSSRADKRQMREENVIPADETVWKAVHACANYLLEKRAQGTVYISQVCCFLEYCQNLAPIQDAVDSPDQRRATNQALKELTSIVQDIRHQQSILMDLWCEEGVESDALRKQVEVTLKLPFRLDEADYLERQLAVVLDWQAKIDLTSGKRSDDLTTAEILLANGATLGVRTKALVQLEVKVERANELRQRIQKWIAYDGKQSMKTLSSLVREVQRLKWHFRETKQLIAIHQDTESWVDRANIAIRSRLSLQEMRELKRKGEKQLPVAVTDLLDKLQYRVNLAESWLEELEEVVPRPEGPIETAINVEWLKQIRHALESESFSSLNELASEGSRLPVQVVAVELLHIEVEARTWTSKADRWKPTGSKRPKLEEIRDHAQKAKALRERLTMLTPMQRDAWELPGESLVKQTVEAADDWLAKYEQEVCGDAISLHRVREIAAEGRSIYVNLGPPSLKMGKLLTQAETWFGKYQDVWKRCSDLTCPKVQLSELREAVHAAENDLSLELQEAVDIQDMVERVETWCNSVTIVTAGKARKGKRATMSIQDLEHLVLEAKSLPIETNCKVETVRKEIESVQAWQATASGKLKEICTSFEVLREVMMSTYGPAADYVRPKGDTKEANTGFNDPPTAAELSNLVEIFRKEAANLCISTPEAEAATTLDPVVRWCLRSLKYLEHQRDIFDKRFFGAFDRFFSEGKAFLAREMNSGSYSCVLQSLYSSLSALVNDQLIRLGVILSDREEYKRWCKTAEDLLAGNDNGTKRPDLEKIQVLSERSRAFPGGCDLVQKLQTLAREAKEWSVETAEALSSDTKMTVAEAKALCDEADKLGFNCPLLRKLKNGLKSARAWAGRVKRSKVDQGAVEVKVVRTLMDEYENLLVELPDELDKLRHAVKNYCLCRRPYEGFMIGCDGCGEWFHGACIGISESKAGKVDKYCCVRCCLHRTFKSSASSVAGVIRKWTCEKDLKKARQVVAQKLQRKVRKENKAIDTLEMEAENLQNQLVRGATPETHSPNHNIAEAGTEEPAPSGITLPSSQEVTATANGDSFKAASRTDNAIDLNAGSSEIPQASSGNTPSTEPFVGEETLSIEFNKERLGKVTQNIEECRQRLIELSEEAIARKQIEDCEDNKCQQLRKWCIRVRSSVLIPSSAEVAIKSRPNPDGSLSEAMLALKAEAALFGLDEFEDATSIMNSFSCMAWAMRATAVMSRQPQAEEVEALVQCASRLKLPDEKAFRMLKSFSQRAQSWKNRVTKILTPRRGETKPIELSLLRDLSRVGDDIPLALPLESRLATVIEDKGARHCVCGGPSDGRFMLGCDKCGTWFHGHCVDVSKDSLGEEDDWICPSCSGSPLENVNVHDFHDRYHADDEHDDPMDEDVDDVSSKAPSTDKMWPPFGLLGSEKSTQVLGTMCCAIPDSTETWQPDKNIDVPHTVDVDCSLHDSKVGTLNVQTDALSGIPAQVSSTNSSVELSEASKVDSAATDGAGDSQSCGHPRAPSTIFTEQSSLTTTDQSFPGELVKASGAHADNLQGSVLDPDDHVDQVKSCALSENSAGSLKAVETFASGGPDIAPNVVELLSSHASVRSSTTVDPPLVASVPAVANSESSESTFAGAQESIDLASALQRQVLVASVQDASRRN